LTEETLTIPVAKAKALLAFASKDDTRLHLACVGLTYSNLDGKVEAPKDKAGRKAKKPVSQFAVLAGCDGHTLVTFRMPFEAWPPYLDGKVVAKSSFGRSYVDVEGRVAAVRKAPVVLLTVALVEAQFPPIQQVEPTPGFLAGTKPVCIDARYLARIALVTKACGSEGAELVTMGAERDPVRFDVRGPIGSARITIMPRIATEERT
jgi:hypothetical protein